MRAALSFLVFMVAATDVASAQSKWWFLENRPYFRPMIAAVRDAQVSAMIGAADRVEFLVKDTDPRLSWDIDLGAELPILGRESRPLTSGRVPDKGHAWGVWFPIDFHMIEDLNTDDSNPIINTDYRFGLMGKLVLGLPKHTQVGLRVHAGHESTHIGDEFAIVGQEAHPETFERINVSWEYVDVLLMADRQMGETVGSIRAGITTSLDDSYYTTDDQSVTHSARGPVTTSKNRYDLHGGVEVQRENILFKDTHGVFVSLEARWRTVYDYHKASDDEGEDRQLSTNLIVGLRRSGPSDYGRFSPFVRLYHGVNPHGQFRNQRDFTIIGAGFRLTH